MFYFPGKYPASISPRQVLRQQAWHADTHCPIRADRKGLVALNDGRAQEISKSPRKGLESRLLCSRSVAQGPLARGDRS